MKKLISAILILCLCLGIYSCSKKDEVDRIESTTTDNDTTTTTDTTAPTVTSVSTTADNQSSVSITDNITVTFSEAMDNTYVTTSTSDTNCAGTIRVSSDNFSNCVRMSSEPVSSNSNKTFILDPYDNLTGSTTYKTRVTTGVKDTAGNSMSSQHDNSTGFTTASTDTTAPVIEEVTAVTTPTNDRTPNYTFSSTEAGTITYGGSCSSSTTSATTDNNTITFSTLDNGTHSNCIIKVTDSSANVSNTLEITDFTVSYSSGWQLIARQVDSDNFTDGTHELFLDNASTTYLQNENDNSSSIFMSIGNLTPSNYVTDGKYKFKLEWDGMTAASLDNKSVTWTQTSWLTDSTVAGFQEIGTSGYVDNSSKGFAGLEKSGLPTSCVIDGNPGGWFHCVGAIVRWQLGIPAPKGTVASSMHLYIWAPEIKETNFALDFDGTNDYVSANGVATELDSSTNLPLSVSAWVYPENGTKDQIVFGFYKNNAFANGPSVWFGGTDFKFAYYNQSISTVHSSSTYAINNWHHVVLTIGSDRNGVLYVNGSSAATFSGVFNSGGLDMFSIAVDYDSSGGTAGNLTQYFDGKIDEVAVWNVALNATDVTSLYNSGNGLKASANSGNYDNSGDLVGYWKFNEGTGSTLTDNTSNSNNGTLTNMDSSDWVTSGSETKPSFQ